MVWNTLYIHIIYTLLHCPIFAHVANINNDGLAGGREKLQRSGVQLFERLAPLGIVDDQLRGSLKPIQYHGVMVLRGLRGALDWSPIMPRDDYLSDNRNDIFSDRLAH